VRIDHVIYATGDLDAAAARLEADLGLMSVEGGRHEGLGTHNRIVPLGAGYLELMAVNDSEAASGSELARMLHARIAEAMEGLFAWAVAVQDIEGVAARLGTPVTAIRREGLSARLTGLAEALHEPCLPFFIVRDPGVPDPGGAADAGGISWVEVAGDHARLEHWIGDDRLPMRVVEGAPGIRAMGIGRRELRTGEEP
jgi:hypothetical protein